MGFPMENFKNVISIQSFTQVRSFSFLLDQAGALPVRLGHGIVALKKCGVARLAWPAGWSSAPLKV